MAFLDISGLMHYTNKLMERINGYVPTKRTVNGKALSSDITLSASDVGAQVSGSYVPTSRKINGKPLTSDITLTASNIGISTSNFGNLYYRTGIITGNGTTGVSKISITIPVNGSTHKVIFFMLKSDADSSSAVIIGYNAGLIFQYSANSFHQCRSSQSYTSGYIEYEISSSSSYLHDLNQKDVNYIWTALVASS